MRLGAKLSFEYANYFRNPEGFDYFELKINQGGSRQPRGWEKWEVIHAPQQQSPIAPEQIKAVESAISLAVQLGSEYVIVHSGSYHKKEEKKIIENLKYLTKLAKKSNIELLLENLHSYDGKHHASSPEELERIIDETGCGFILDLPHAHCYARQHGLTPVNVIMAFTKLKPKMYHLSDSFRTNKVDQHLTLGRGDLDIKFYLKIIGNGRCTLEISPPTVDNYIQSKKFIEDLKK